VAKKYLSFTTEAGEDVVFEVEAEPGEEIERISRRGGEKVVERAEETLEHAINRIRPAAELVLNAFREANQPSEIALEFGLKVSGKVGMVFASADSEATFKVSLKWSGNKG